MLVGAAGFVQALREIRVVHIAGRFGGGKTSMAFMLATIFAERYGYSVVSNVASPIADDWETIVYRPYEGCRAFVIVDEGGLWLQDAASCQAVAAYAAKLDCVFVIPSRVEPHRSFSALWLQPVWGLYGVLIPYLHYRWGVALGKQRSQGAFGWWRSSEVHGLYSRNDPGSDAGLLDLVERWNRGLMATHGRSGSAPGSLAPQEVNVLMPSYLEGTDALPD